MDNWISVEDRLPEETGKYLVVVSIGSKDVIDLSFGVMADPQGFRFTASDYQKVIQWQPLPKLPKEKK